MSKRKERNILFVIYLKIISNDLQYMRECNMLGINGELIISDGENYYIPYLVTHSKIYVNEFISSRSGHQQYTIKKISVTPEMISSQLFTDMITQLSVRSIQLRAGDIPIIVSAIEEDCWKYKVVDILSKYYLKESIRGESCIVLQVLSDIITKESYQTINALYDMKDLFYHILNIDNVVYDDNYDIINYYALFRLIFYPSFGME